MLGKLNDQPVVTYLLCLLALVVVIAGGIVTIVRPTTLPFHEYVQNVSILTAALGLGAGVGRGIEAAAKPSVDPTPGDVVFTPEPSSAPET